MLFKGQLQWFSEKVCVEEGGGGEWAVGYGYKRATVGILVMIELFSILTVVVETQTLHVTKLHRTKYTHTSTHTQIQVHIK